MRAFVCLILCCLASVAHASIAPGDEAVQHVLTFVTAGDCPGAVRKLNAGLADRYPEVALLAGAMFEEGTCVKPDWIRAVGYYIQAHEGGQAPARYRLAAGYASPAGGPDMAAALWWAHRARSMLGAQCVVARTDDPDRFVEALRLWSKRRLEACNYAVGVMATMSGEIQYPSVAQQHWVTGDVVLAFTPSIPHIEIKGGAAEAVQTRGWVDGNVIRDRSAKFVTGSFADTVRKASERALKRYPQPAGMDPAWIITMSYKFTLE